MTSQNVPFFWFGVFVFEEVCRFRAGFSFLPFLFIVLDCLIKINFLLVRFWFFKEWGKKKAKLCITFRNENNVSILFRLQPPREMVAHARWTCCSFRKVPCRLLWNSINKEYFFCGNFERVWKMDVIVFSFVARFKWRNVLIIN